MSPLEPGSRLGAYRIIRQLGAGGMGRVYEVEHAELKIRRALKVFTCESEHRELLRKRFAAEGRILADLRHQRIVRVYDFAVDDASGTPYFAMDYVVSPSGEPQTLEDACREGVDEERVAGWFRDICEGLAYIHSKGVIHRDISLDNILIDGEGRAVLSDFGVARIIGEDYRRRLEVTATMPFAPGERLSWGKGLYLAPEMKGGAEATPYTDAYALGVLLFRLLVGAWYTPDTRLDDALAGMDYNWAEVIGRLCDVDCTRRLGCGGIAGRAGLLRKSAAEPASVAGRVGLVIALVAALAAALAGTAVWRLRRSPSVPEASPVPPAAFTNAAAPRTDAVSPVYHIVDVTNYVSEKVYQVVTFTNFVERPAP